MIRLATSILVLLVATTLTAGASAADLVAPQPDSVLTAGRTYTAAGTV
ncbi:MAG: hypothetical protein HY815_18415, partial [Candidatus Riflebacteria bacterium]|nr:hypothetical protein [Candidatus Riflebacteria bacterium]